jgi:two-component system, response regulator
VRGSEADGVGVLLAESDDAGAESTIAALRNGNFGTKLFRVNDGREALDFVNCSGAFAGRDRNDFPRLILLGLMLPGLNGLDVLRALKGDARTHAVPVVVMVADSERHHVTACYELGANGYVTKPPLHYDLQNAIASIGTFWLLLNRVPA